MIKIKPFIRKCENYDHHNHVGTIIGINNNVTSHLNCDYCLDDFLGDYKEYARKENTKLKYDICTGYKYQCIEFVRRWLVVNKKFFFNNVCYAHEIFDKICNVEHVENKTYHSLVSYKNQNKYHPKFADLIIFPISRGQLNGHAGIITCVNSELSYVEIAEQNTDNVWEDPKSFSRRLVMIHYDNFYTVTEMKWKVSVIDFIKKANLENEVVKREKDKVI